MFIRANEKEIGIDFCTVHHPVITAPSLSFDGIECATAQLWYAVTDEAEHTGLISFMSILIHAGRGFPVH